jgi:hypothetical protein
MYTFSHAKINGSLILSICPCKIVSCWNRGKSREKKWFNIFFPSAKYALRLLPPRHQAGAKKARLVCSVENAVCIGSFLWKQITLHMSMTHVVNGFLYAKCRFCFNGMNACQWKRIFFCTAMILGWPFFDFET